MKKTALLIMNIIILFSGCVSSPDPKENSIVDEIFTRQNSSLEYEANADFQPISQGQWMILRKQEGKEQVYWKYAAYLDTSGNKWIEINDFRKNKEIIIQFQVATYNTSSIDELGIVKGHYYQNDRQMDNAVMMMRTYLQPIIMKKSAIKMNVSVPTPAGIFNNVYGHSGSTYREFSFESKSVSISIKDTQSGTMFYHPVLPFNGLVGWNSTNDRAEVVEFGFTGAAPVKALE